MTNPLVSILIPCYNAEKWVAETLECALGQTWENKEIIVVNDGSTDRSSEAICPFEARGVKIISQAHVGASAARNRALLEAKGDFIQYLDADDLMSRNKIETQVKKLLEAGPGYIASCGWGYFKDSAEEADFIRSNFWEDMDPVDFLVSMWNEGMMSPNCWLIPNNATNQAGPWNETLSHSDDGEYFCRVVLASKGIRFCPGVQVYYRKSGPSLSTLNTREKLISRYRVIELTINYLLSAENSERTRKASAIRLQRFAYNNYPGAPDLCNAAAGKARELNNGKTPLTILPPRIRFVAQVFGWRTARSIQLAVDSLIGKFTKEVIKF